MELATSLASLERRELQIIHVWTLYGESTLRRGRVRISRSELDRCAVGLAECNDFAPCPLHDTWKSVRAHLLQYLKKTNLEEMATPVEQKKELLAQSRRPYQKRS